MAPALREREQCREGRGALKKERRALKSDEEKRDPRRGWGEERQCGGYMGERHEGGEKRMRWMRGRALHAWVHGWRDALDARVRGGEEESDACMDGWVG